MPTYTYRCLYCQVVQSLAHGMNESPCPPCLACGGLTERIVTQSPRVLSATSDRPASLSDPDAAPTEVNATDHACHPTCALHRLFPTPESGGGPKPS